MERIYFFLRKHGHIIGMTEPVVHDEYRRSEIKQRTEGRPGTGDYNERGCFSPDGKCIVWMWNKDNKNKGTDCWIMNSDGTDKKRITFFNQPDHPRKKGTNRIVVSHLIFNFPHPIASGGARTLLGY